MMMLCLEHEAASQHRLTYARAVQHASILHAHNAWWLPHIVQNGGGAVHHMRFPLTESGGHLHPANSDIYVGQQM